MITAAVTATFIMISQTRNKLCCGRISDRRRPGTSPRAANMTFVDSHCHIDGPEYDVDRDEVIARAREAGVTTMLNVGTGDPHSGVFERAVALAEQHPEVYCAIGVHPHDAKLFDEAAQQRLINLAKQSSRVVAWGEIGLDYHYDHSPREVQRDVFRRQLGIARELNLPVVIHSRAADEDTIAILRENCGTGVSPVNHAQDARATRVPACCIASAAAYKWLSRRSNLDSLFHSPAISLLRRPTTCAPSREHFRLSVCSSRRTVRI